MNPITEFVFDFCILKGAQDGRSMSLAKPKKFFLRSLSTRSGRELSAFEDYVHVIELKCNKHEAAEEKKISQLFRKTRKCHTCQISVVQDFLFSP